MPQTPVGGTCTKQSGHSTTARSGIVGAAALRGVDTGARRARSGADTGGASFGEGL